MSSIRVSGNTSGHYDLTVPDVAGSNTIALDKIVVSDSSGNVGIGTTQPDLKLHVDGTNGYPASSGNTPVGHIAIRAKNESSSHGAHIGVGDSPPWATWIQAQDINNLATSYPLLLNPNGGNVGIGTSSPVTNLHIQQTGTSGNNYKEGSVKIGSTYGVEIAYNSLSSGRASFTSLNNVGTTNNRMSFGFGAITSGGEPTTNVMTLNQAGHVTMPYQPAWHLQPSWTSNTTPSSNSIIPFGVYGGHGTFATSVTVSSGRVTVPVSGKYWIAATMRQEKSQTDYQISLRKNGAQYIRSGIWYSSQAYENIHLMGMLSLAANDYLEIDINSSNMPPINGNTDTLTFFSGYLVG